MPAKQKKTGKRPPTAKESPLTQQPGLGFDFRWQNFRGFTDSDWVEVRPITIFVGPNNSGKSSLFAPLLLLKQTLRSGDETLALKTTGPLANLGAFSDFVHDHNTDQVVSFHLRFRDIGAQVPRPLQRAFSGPGVLSLGFRRGARDSEIVLQKFELRDTRDHVVVVRERLSDGNYSLVFNGKMPTSVKEAIVSAKPEHFFFPTTTLLMERFDQFEQKRQRGRSTTLSLPGYFPIITIAQAQIAHFFSHVSYVGPLRKQPKRFYEISGETPGTVGVQGQNTAEILFKRKDPKFVKSINEWVKKFDLGNEIKCELLCPGIFAVRLSHGKGGDIDFADSGFGLSQILPLIVQGFHGTPGDMIVVEQPEIHLNPKLQCALADFFAALIPLQKGVIVETHSEHLIMRMRTLIAQGSVRPDDVALYFVEHDQNTSSVRRISINADGHIRPDEWPKGFFEESLREALTLASAGSTRSDP